MPLVSRPQLVLLEIACAAALIAVAFQGAWLVAGSVACLLCLLLALPVRGRPLRLVLQSWMSMKSRRADLRSGHGVASLAGGDYDVVSVPAVGGGVPIGAIRDGSTWSVPLSLPLNDMFNNDAPIPLERVSSLLMVEDVPLTSVRLVTTIAPARVPPQAPPGPAAPSSRFATRHLVLTLDTLYAADAIAARGGQPAINQILRRCVLRAEEVLTSAGVEVRRLPQDVVSMDNANCLGPMSPGPDGRLPTATENLGVVRMDTTVAKTFAITGPDAVTRLDQLAAMLRTQMVATSVVLGPGSGHQPPTMSLLLRVSGTADVVAGAERHLTSAGRTMGLRVLAVSGEQAPLLRATTLLGVPVAAA